MMEEKYDELKKLLEQAQVESDLCGCLGQGMSVNKISIHCNLLSTSIKDSRNFYT